MMEMSRGRKAGIKLADSIIEMVHLMYQSKTANNLMDALIGQLNERRSEFVPVKKGNKFPTQAKTSKTPDNEKKE